MQDDAGRLHECRAVGRFRKDGLKPLVGDFVEFEPGTETATGVVQEIAPRHNVLVRPPVANLDLELIVASPRGPAVDKMLVDKLILQARYQGISPILCVSKADLYPEEARGLARSYDGACETVCLSAVTGEGMEHLQSVASGRTVGLAGQSAAGKTTLLNALCGTNRMTGGLSARTERGKHTTRSAELLYSPGLNAYFVDTPGFSVFDGVDLAPREISKHYADFVPYLDDCRFSSCVHDSEPDCAVREAVEKGDIDSGRYERYLRLLHSEGRSK